MNYLSLCSIITATLTMFGEAKDEGEKISVSADHLSEKVSVVGKLGRPLGHMFTLKGSVEEKRSLGYELEGHEFVFKIREVNGEPLGNPIYVAAISHAGKIPKDRDIVVRGFETGEFRNYPDEVIKSHIVHKPGTPPPAQAGKFGFYTFFTILRLE
jgi:hypothetical protein